MEKTRIMTREKKQTVADSGIGDAFGRLQSVKQDAKEEDRAELYRNLGKIRSKRYIDKIILAKELSKKIRESEQKIKDTNRYELKESDKAIKEWIESIDREIEESQELELEEQNIEETADSEYAEDVEGAEEVERVEDIEADSSCKVEENQSKLFQYKYKVDKQAVGAEIEKLKRQLQQELKEIEAMRPKTDEFLGHMFFDTDVDELIRRGILKGHGQNYNSTEELLEQVNANNQKEETQWLKGDKMLRTEKYIVVEVYLEAVCGIYDDGSVDMER